LISHDLGCVIHGEYHRSDHRRIAGVGKIKQTPAYDLLVVFYRHSVLSLSHDYTTESGQGEGHIPCSIRQRKRVGMDSDFFKLQEWGRGLDRDNNGKPSYKARK